MFSYDQVNGHCIWLPVINRCLLTSKFEFLIQIYVIEFKQNKGSEGVKTLDFTNVHENFLQALYTIWRSIVNAH